MFLIKKNTELHHSLCCFGFISIPEAASTDQIKLVLVAYKDRPPKMTYLIILLMYTVSTFLQEMPSDL